MNIHNKLQVGVPFSSIRQGDLFCVHGPAGGLFIKLGGDHAFTTRYPFNSYKVGEERGGRNIFDDDMVWPVSDVTVS